MEFNTDPSNGAQTGKTVFCLNGNPGITEQFLKIKWSDLLFRMFREAKSDAEHFISHLCKTKTNFGNKSIKRKINAFTFIHAYPVHNNSCEGVFYILP